MILFFIFFFIFFCLLLCDVFKNFKAEDLSITRIAGLTWTEWNARLAMPLVTSLREGKHPLLFPTDLTIEKQSNSSSKSTIHEQSTSSSPDRKSPGFYSPNNSGNCIPSNALTSTPAQNSSSSSSNSNNNNNSSNTNNQKLNNSGSNNTSNSNNNNSKVNNNYSIKCELKSPLDGACSDNEQDAGTFDSKNASGLCNINNINLLSSLSAMSSFMNSAAVGGGGAPSSAHHSLGSGGNTSMLGGANSVGHPCPDCGRLYKLKSSLRNHQKWECGKEPQFKCPFCVYRAKQKMHIGRHMERMHKEKFMKLDEKIFAAAAEEAGVHLPPFLN